MSNEKRQKSPSKSSTPTGKNDAAKQRNPAPAKKAEHAPTPPPPNDDALVDESGRETFPASDPPSWTPTHS